MTDSPFLPPDFHHRLPDYLEPYRSDGIEVVTAGTAVQVVPISAGAAARIVREASRVRQVLESVAPYDPATGQAAAIELLSDSDAAWGARLAFLARHPRRKWLVEHRRITRGIPLGADFEQELARYDSRAKELHQRYAAHHAAAKKYAAIRSTADDVLGAALARAETDGLSVTVSAARKAVSDVYVHEPAQFLARYSAARRDPSLSAAIDRAAPHGWEPSHLARITIGRALYRLEVDETPNSAQLVGTIRGAVTEALDLDARAQAVSTAKPASLGDSTPVPPI